MKRILIIMFIFVLAQGRPNLEEMSNEEGSNNYEEQKMEKLLNELDKNQKSIKSRITEIKSLEVVLKKMISEIYPTSKNKEVKDWLLEYEKISKKNKVAELLKPSSD